MAGLATLTQSAQVSGGITPVVVRGDVTIAGNITAGDVIGRSRISGTVAGRDIVIDDGSNEAGPAKPQEVLSSEQALGRIADAVRLNLGQLQLNMEQARRESGQFFKTMMIFSAIAFSVVLAGIGFMLSGFVAVGVVTTASSLVPKLGAFLFFNKDKELRKTIETYHGHILESQRVLTMIDLAETMADTVARDSVKEKIIYAVLKVSSPKK